MRQKSPLTQAKILFKTVGGRGPVLGAALSLLCLRVGGPALADVPPGASFPAGETADLIQHLTGIAPFLRLEGEPLGVPDPVAAFYRARGFRPAWVGPGGVSPDARDLLALLQSAPGDGLSPEDYHLAYLERRLAAPTADPLELAELDVLLSDAFLAYARDRSTGRVDPLRTGLDWHIEPPHYDLPALLEQGLKGRRLRQAVEASLPQAPGYRRLHDAMARYRRLVAAGGWPAVAAGPPLRRGMAGERVRTLRRRLALSGDLDKAAAGDSDRFDAALGRAVRRFQHRYALRADGVVGSDTLAALNVPASRRLQQIALNLERWRWLPRIDDPRYVMVNMAGFELRLVEAGQTVKRMRVIVGRDYRQTPVFSGALNTLVFNPYWYVPDTVLREDLLPALNRDPGLLARMDLKVFSDLRGNGREVDPAAVRWPAAEGTAFPYTLRQEPGPRNALGRIKFLFPNPFGIYLHDTPNRALFGRSERALSSGCIRVEDPVGLAVRLLGDEGAWGRGAVEAAIDAGRPQRVALAKAVPIYLVYWTAWVGEDGAVQFRDDIYGRDKRLAQALQRPAACCAAPIRHAALR